MGYRELTAKEKRDIKELVTKSCANYCNHYKECLPLDSDCYMLNLHYFRDNLCKYFKSSVLLLNPNLEAYLYNPSHNRKSCVICGGDFAPTGNQTTCSKNSSDVARKITTRKRVRKHRQSMR